MSDFCAKASMIETLQDQPVCRICLDSAKPLIRVCNCAGTISYVHYSCGGEWVCRQLDDDAADDFENCQVPHCELCHTEYSAYLTLEEEEVDGDHFAEYYGLIDWSHRLYLLFLLAGILFSVYAIVMEVWTWWKVAGESLGPYWTHLVLPVWFVGHGLSVLREDGREISKLCKRQIFVELKALEELV